MELDPTIAPWNIPVLLWQPFLKGVHASLVPWLACGWAEWMQIVISKFRKSLFRKAITEQILNIHCNSKTYQ